MGTLGGSRLLYLRRVDQFDATPIRGTDNATTCHRGAAAHELEPVAWHSQHLFRTLEPHAHATVGDRVIP